MEQPIWILQAGSDPSEDLCAEVLRCEGFPWFDERPAEAFDGVPPGVGLLVVAGAGIDRGTAERLAKAVSGGVSLIAVAPEARRRGIGRRLLEAVIARATQAGLSLFLEVRADNSAALEMYRTLNFKPVGVRRGYYKGADGIQRDSYTLRCNHR